MINANGNAMFLSPEGEIARWGVESKLIARSTASDLPLGVPDTELLDHEVNAYAEIGLFDGMAPDISTVVDTDAARGVYDDDRQGHLAGDAERDQVAARPSTRAGVLDVVLQLADQRIDAVELALAAQEVGEAHLGPLAVEVAVEVEQVRLEQRVVGVLVERRPPAEVDRARVHVAVGPLVPAGVHAVGGQADGVGHLDVGRREAEQPAALVADARPRRGPRTAGRAARRRARPGRRRGPDGWRSS